MSEAFFWKHWDKTSKYSYLIIFALFVICVLYYLTSYIIGEDAVLNWIVVSKSQPVRVLLDTFSSGAIDFNTYANNFLISETFQGSDIKINYTAAYIFLLMLGTGATIYLSVITYLSRFWYVVGIALFALFAVNLKLEQLLLFGRSDKAALIGTFILYLPLSYYFNAFAKNASFLKRVIAFFSVTTLFVLIIYFFAEVNNPFLYLANYGIIFPIIASIAFIFMVSIEIVGAFLYFITRSNTENSKNTLTHFLLIFLIYFINLLLVYLHNRKFIEWDIYYVDEFILLLFSVIIGIWGFKHRSTLFESFLPFRFQGALIYLALGIICFGTIGYLFNTANDPLIETMEDAIIFSHLCFGFFFFIYIISNFIGLLYNNLKVYKVVYEPKRMPYFTSRLVGLIAVAALFFQSNRLAMDQAIAGYYNGIGDLYTAVDDFYVAEQYYKLGSQYGLQNHRSNYGLASLANKENDNSKALYHYQKSILKKPTIYAYVNLANIYAANGLFFDALFTLKEGLDLFPNNEEIRNNLGVLYAQTDIADSAFLFLNVKGNSRLTSNVARTNVINLLAKNRINTSVDSLMDLYGKDDYLPYQNNLLVIGNQNKQNLLNHSGHDFDIDSVLNPNTSAYVFNNAFNNLYGQDTSIISGLNRFTEHPENFVDHNNLEFVKALNLYKEGDLIKAFRLVDILQSNSSADVGYYNNMLGLWALQQRAFRSAIEFFDRAVTYDFEEAKVNLAIALLRDDSLASAKMVMEQLIEEQGPNENSVISTLMKLMDIKDIASITNLPDREKCMALWIHQRQFSFNEVLSIIRSIEQNYTKQLAIYEALDYTIQFGSDPDVQQLLDMVREMEAQGSRLVTDLYWLELKWLVKKKHFNEIEGILARISDDHRNSVKKQFYQAVVSMQNGSAGDKLETLKTLSEQDPFFEPMLVYSAELFHNELKDDLLAYNTLLNALQINPYSIELNKAYALQSLRSGLISYGERAMVNLKPMLSPRDFADFQKIYQMELTKIESENTEWQ
ncbi:hypothetical protein QQ008_18750 [Fulvivirgaceae bacterium BMA10]|uniref:Tetratricopeptide repeat protein n=1 Tax=Splendidivirga corallicola TaxID=3051826 RepID=A0ABT8KUX7_9BACT|nr:hypothetical protein [Fulvivirgaceae bacterium BMA10]